MSTQSGWMRSMNSCVRYLRSSRSICGREFRRTLGRSTYNNVWNTTKDKIENVKAMRRNAFLNDTPVRRYDDKYNKLNQRFQAPKSYAKVKMPRHRDNDHKVRTGGTYDRYLSASEQRDMTEMSDDDRYDVNFDPRFNDRHYRTYRKPSETQKHDNFKMSNYEWVEGENNDENEPYWNSWNIKPRGQEEMRELVAEEHKQEQENTKSKPANTNSEYLYRQWQVRPEPDRRLRSPSNPGTVYQFKKDVEQPSKIYDRKMGDADANEVEHKPVKKAYNKYAEMVRKEHEKQFWHRWDTCPDERRIYSKKVDAATTDQAANERDYDDQDTDEVSRRTQQTQGHRYSDKRKGLIRPPQNFSGAKRKYQTSSRLSPTNIKSESVLALQQYGIDMRATSKRKLSGMEKQFQKMWSIRHKNKQDMQMTHEVSPRRSIENLKLTPTKTESVLQQRECDPSVCTTCHHKCSRNSSKNSRKRLAAFAKRNSKATPIIDRVLEEENEHQVQTRTKCKEEVVCATQSRLLPPRIRVKVTSAQRRSVPRPSFSECYDLDTDEIQHTEYTGFGRPTISDIWTKFTRNPIAKLL